MGQKHFVYPRSDRDADGGCGRVDPVQRKNFDAQHQKQSVAEIQSDIQARVRSDPDGGRRDHDIAVVIGAGVGGWDRQSGTDHICSRACRSQWKKISVLQIPNDGAGREGEARKVFGGESRRST